MVKSHLDQNKKCPHLFCPVVYSVWAQEAGPELLRSWSVGRRAAANCWVWA